MQSIQPKGFYEEELTLPGDKSITHRAVMFNAMAEGEATVTDALVGEDCLSTCRCMRALGATVEVDGTSVRVKGVAEFVNGAKLDCGNSGTTMRLMTGLCAGKGIEAELCGDPSLSSRPMERVAEPLRNLGAAIRTTDGHAPVFVSPAKITGGEITLKVASAQLKSAVLLAGLSAENATAVEEPALSRDHTERLLQTMGAKITRNGLRTTVEKSTLTPVDVRVPADISSAAYFMALGALKGKTLCKNVGVNPTRTGILTAFDRLGVRYTLQNERLSCGEEVADILVEKSPLRAIEITQEDVPKMIDELPLIALLCAFAEGESRISGARELRVKESDRIRATRELIEGLGGTCKETEDGWIIHGRKTLSGGVVKTYLDHRIAMTGAVALAASEKGGAVDEPSCCAISFPNFFALLDERKGAGSR